MFVDITDFKGAIEVENMLAAYKRGEEKITPEVCFEVLKATNYNRNIKDMLACVLKLPIEEQRAFKDVVVSAFEQREQPNDVLVLGKKLAVAGGYEAKLGKIAGVIQKGNYLKSAVNVDRWFVTREEDWAGKDLSAYRKMMFIGKKSDLRWARGLPEDLDVSMCDEVDFGGCDLAPVRNLRFKEGAKVDLREAKNLPEDLDVSMCDEVDFGGCDLAPVRNLRFKDGAYVVLREAKNLPEDLDVSMCDEVVLEKCDLAPVKNLRFKAGAKVGFWRAKNLPEELDVSMCDVVELCECDLAGVKNLQFKDGANVYLHAAKNLPEELDVSMCDEVNLRECDLTGVKSLKFKKGAKVNLRQAKNLPEELDVSMCDEVNLWQCDLNGVKKLRFKSKKQKSYSELRRPGKWDGEFVFADEEAASGKLSAAEIAARDKGGR